MTKEEALSTWGGGPNNASKFGALLLVSITSVWLAYSGWSRGNTAPLWDLDVYLLAAASESVGGSPYALSSGLSFVYHPYVYFLFKSLERVGVLEATAFTFYAASSVYFFFWLHRYVRIIQLVISPIQLLLFVLLPAFALGGTGLTAFLSGNLTTFLHLAILGQFFRCLDEKTRRLNATVTWSVCIFLAALCLFSLVKPYLILYLALLVFILPARTAAGLGVFTSITVCFVWFSVLLFDWQLYRLFLLSLASQTLEKRDLGFSVFGVVSRHHTYQVATLAHLVFASSVLLGLAVFIKRGLSKSTGLAPHLAPLFVVLIALVNPRMKEYDFVICIIFLLLFLATTRPLIYPVIASIGVLLGGGGWSFSLLALIFLSFFVPGGLKSFALKYSETFAAKTLHRHN